MGGTNYGTQTHSFSLGEIGRAINFNNLNYKIIPLGVFEGFDVTKVDDITVAISSGVAVIQSNNESNVVKLKTDSSANISVDNTKDYVILRHTWSNTIGNNYTDFLSVATGDLLSTDIILGRLEWDTVVLTAIDETVKNYSPLQTISDRLNTLNVIADDPESSSVKVLKGGELLVNNNIVTVADNDSVSLTSTILGRIDYIYIDTTGSLSVIEGSDAGVPVAPAIPNDGVVIAKVTRGASRTTVKGSEITQYKFLNERYDELIQNYTQKSTYYTSDKILISDDEDSDNKKYIEESVIVNKAQAINDLTDAVIGTGDKIMFSDSSDSDNPKSEDYDDIKTDIVSEAQDINGLSDATIGTGDEIMFSDSSDSNNPKKESYDDIKTDIVSEAQDINGLTTAIPVTADTFIFNDSSDSNNPKKTTFGEIKWDTYYEKTSITTNATHYINLSGSYTRTNTAIVGISVINTSSGGSGTACYIDQFGFGRSTNRIYFVTTGLAGAGDTYTVRFYVHFNS
jgi:hypothetical protein